MMHNDGVENELARNIDAKEWKPDALVRGNLSFFLQFALPGYKILAMSRDNDGRWLQPSQRKVLLAALEAIPLKTAFEDLVNRSISEFKIGDLVTDDERIWCLDNLRRKLIYRMWSVYFCSATTTVIGKLRTLGKEEAKRKKKEIEKITANHANALQVPITDESNAPKPTKNKRKKPENSGIRNKGGVRNRFRAERQRK
jgi:hypothetical protein